MDYYMLRFMWSLQGLAAPADVQLELFPDFVWKVDEIAIDFEKWYEVIKQRRTHFTSEQASLLEKLNNQLDEISGPENIHYWMEETLRTDETWEQIRDTAKAALRAFGWVVKGPPKNRGDTYISAVQKAS